MKTLFLSIFPFILFAQPATNYDKGQDTKIGILTEKNKSLQRDSAVKTKQLVDQQNQINSLKTLTSALLTKFNDLNRTVAYIRIDLDNVRDSFNYIRGYGSLKIVSIPGTKILQFQNDSVSRYRFGNMTPYQFNLLMSLKPKPNPAAKKK